MSATTLRRNAVKMETLPSSDVKPPDTAATTPQGLNEGSMKLVLKKIGMFFIPFTEHCL